MSIERVMKRFVSAAMVGTLVVMGCPSVSTGVAAADPGIGLGRAAWTATQDSAPKFPKVHVQTSVPVTMSDGTVLRADVYRPAGPDGAPVAEKTPTIVSGFPYHKLILALTDFALNIPALTPFVLELVNRLNFSGTPISGIRQLQDIISGGGASVFGVDRKLVQSGYTQVIIDVRGTGTSQGKWQVLGDREQQDTLEMLAWARKQPWSNGKLGMSGSSYAAINQMQAASRKPEGLEAIFPVVPSTDVIRDAVAPGAGLGVGFTSVWLALVNGNAKIPDLQALLRGEFDPQWLIDRFKDPLVFVDVILQAIAAPTPDVLSPQARDVVTADSAYRKALLTSAEKITTPTMVVGQWHDIFTTTEWQTLSKLSSLPPSKKKLVMGAGYHMNTGVNMGGAGQPPRVDVLQRAWFDKWLKGIDNGIDRYSPATINQIGGGWVQDDTFPRQGQTYRRQYLSDTRSGSAPHALRDGSLTAARPDLKATWTVAPGLATICSNDAVQSMVGIPVVLDVCADDNRIAESNALTFTSPPVSRSTDISGPINVHLSVKTDARDGFFNAVLTDVAPDGRSRVISSGAMTVSIKDQLVRSQSMFSPNGDLTYPFYALDVGQRRTVEPGSTSVLEIGTHATDARLEPGHRLRLSVYAMNFPKAIPLGPVRVDSELKPEHVVLDPKAPSWVNLPSNRPIG